MTNTPDKDGRFGSFGGRYVAETLMPPILALQAAYEQARADKTFWAEFDNFAQHYVGRPSPLYFAQRLTERAGGAKIYLKREDLNHTGAHKINNVLGQLLLAKRMGKTRIIAETGAGQHGVATATMAARLGMDCIVFMGAVDIERQKPNVFRMKLLGAEVRAVTSGTSTLKDAMNDALRDWVTHAQETFYCIGTVAGPHPYPEMVREFQSIIGREAKVQILEAENRLPDAVIACIGGGSNAMGIFHEFIGDKHVRLIGVEAAGRGVDTGLHAASLTGGTPGILHGNRTYLLQDEHGQINDAHSVSAGLDYPGIGPEHSYLHEIGRAEYLSCTDDEAVEAFQICTKLEGIIPALESAHAIPRALDLAKELGEDGLIILNMSGRGDKDVNTIAGLMGVEV
ncbi:MAG: tryptophan synthase subunit beta [Robiginitomaculum sp.]|nr:MAG: tryptophan synthase subunit beta [Robiginitomaculum sp.]